MAWIIYRAKLLWLYFTKYMPADVSFLKWAFAKWYWVSVSFESKHADGRDIIVNYSRPVTIAPFGLVTPKKHAQIIRQQILREGWDGPVGKISIVAWTRVSRSDVVISKEEAK